MRLFPNVAEVTNSAQGAIDSFVEAVFNDARDAIERVGSYLAAQILDAGWQVGITTASGTLLQFDMVPMSTDDEPADCPGIELLEDVVSPERWSDIEDSDLDVDSLTEEEIGLWQGLAAEQILEENPDHDVYSNWSVRRVTHSDGRVAYFCDVGGGYSASEPFIEFVCGATTENKAIAELRQRGFTDVDDFRARWKRP